MRKLPRRSIGHRQVRAIRQVFEQLEKRQLLSLLGVAPSFPLLSTNQTGTVNYTYDSTSSVGSFDLSSSPFTFRQDATTPPYSVLSSTAVPNDFQIHFKTDGSGNVTGGVAGDDFTVSGNVDLNRDHIVDAGDLSGTLLTGEISAFGSSALGTTSQFDFIFTPTGGLLLSNYPTQFQNMDIGVTMTSEGSTFTGNFTQNFTGSVKAAAGPVGIPSHGPASPTLTTTASFGGGNNIVGSAIPQDSAVLAGGNSETGNITFTLTDQNGNTIDQEIIAANGDGTYTTSNTNIATTVGTYTWSVAYAGDANNSPAVDQGGAAEQVAVVTASPAINTSQQPATASVGGTIADQATVSGGYNPSGTVTFNLYNNPNGTGTPLFTDTEALVGGVATSSSYTTTVTGNDYWVATYNGDSNNSPVASGLADEPVVISPVSPSINTSQQPATAVVGSSVADQATVTGGYNPTGTVTFNLYDNAGGTGTPLFTDTENLVGGVATSSGYTATAAGTDYWVATYSGDTNNSSATSPATSEPVTVATATPSINTSQQPATAVVGGTIADQATVSGGYNPSGTVTFNLYNNPNGTGTPLFTDTEALVGGVATSSSYTTTVTGKDYWVATYNGDSNNSTAVSGPADEPVTISPVSPSITTTPGGSISRGGITISGTKYNDLTGNGFSSDDTAQSGVTIDLYEESNHSSGLQTSGDTLVATAKTGIDGTFSFSVTGAGTYYVAEAVPSGYIQTGGGPNGSAGATYYTVSATAGNSYAGYNFADYKIPTCQPTCVSYTVTHSGKSCTYSSLDGHTHPGDTVTVTFTVPSGMNDNLTLVSYDAPSSSWSDSAANQQLIYQQATGTFSPGKHTLTVTIPNAYYQIDFVCGPAISQFEPNQNGNAYGPDSSNITYHSENRFIDSDSGGSSAGTLNHQSPMVPNPTTTPLPGQALTDSATLSGGLNPTGTITFYLFAPGVTPNANNSNAVYSDTVIANGDGNYSTSTGTNPGGYVPTTGGTYEWIAVYSGDANNASVAGNFGDEPEAVNGASPTLSTSPFCSTATITTPSNNNCWYKYGGSTTTTVTMFNDSATITGGDSPTGTVTFYLFAPGVTPATNYSNAVYSDTVTVTGNGTYTTNSGNNSGGFQPTAAGTYEWVAVYSGDASNNSVAGNFGDEPEQFGSNSCTWNNNNNCSSNNNGWCDNNNSCDNQNNNNCSSNNNGWCNNNQGYCSNNNGCYSSGNNCYSNNNGCSNNNNYCSNNNNNNCSSNNNGWCSNNNSNCGGNSYGCSNNNNNYCSNNSYCGGNSGYHC